MVPAILAAAPLIGKIFGGAGQGAATQRLGENDQRLRAAESANRDALARAGLMANYNLSGANLDLARTQFQQQEPTVQAGQALRGSMLQRIQPLQLSGLSDRVSARMPQMNSIIDAIGPEARQAGALLAQRGLSGLEKGPTRFQPLPQVNLPPMQMAALQKSGLLEKILGTVGLIGSTVGAFGDIDPNANTSGNNLPIDEHGGG
jgi:hypothetical protein